MRNLSLLCWGLIALAGPARASAQWVVPCDPEAPRTFACWPNADIFAPSSVAVADSEEQEQPPPLEPVPSMPPADKELPKERPLSLVEMAAMSNLIVPQPTGFFRDAYPSIPHERSWQEVWMDCRASCRGCVHVPHKPHFSIHRLLAGWNRHERDCGTPPATSVEPQP